MYSPTYKNLAINMGQKVYYCQEKCMIAILFPKFVGNISNENCIFAQNYAYLLCISKVI